MTMRRPGRHSMVRKSILKSSRSDMRGGTPGRSKRSKRAVSFSANLERVHLFDPSQTFKRGRNFGNSLDFRINITASKRHTSKNQRTFIGNHILGNASATAKRPDFTFYEQQLLSQMKGLKKGKQECASPEAKPTVVVSSSFI